MHSQHLLLRMLGRSNIWRGDKVVEYSNVVVVVLCLWTSSKPPRR